MISSEAFLLCPEESSGRPEENLGSREWLCETTEPTGRAAREPGRTLLENFIFLEQISPSIRLLSIVQAIFTTDP